jgi:hypothetical protein
MATANPQELVDTPGGELGDRIREVADRAMGAPTGVAR